MRSVPPEGVQDGGIVTANLNSGKEKYFLFWVLTGFCKPEWL
jgi:hypothetical protein